MSRISVLIVAAVCLCDGGATAQSPLETIEAVEGQPLGANIARVVQAMEYLGHPFHDEKQKQLLSAAQERDATKLQRLLDPHVLFVISLNPEVRVKVARGPAPASLQQGGYTPHVVKVINHSTVTRELRINSPQMGPVYAGAAEGILKRQAQTELKINENVGRKTDRFLDVEMFNKQPMTRQLSGLVVEYAVALIYCDESGKREATIDFDVGDGTQDLGFRGEVPVLFDVKPAIPVKLRVADMDGTATTARLTFRDKLGHVYPPQAKRLAPDFFFQPHIYRSDGDSVQLPPGQFTMTSTRGPEYREQTATVVVEPRKSDQEINVQLERWINPQEFGYYCGDHHIHGAGCSHYENPTQGVSPKDMFAQVRGEGLNVGCVLTWGPCFDFQRRFFSPEADAISEPTTILKYDLEISGFGSAALGHVCLLNLKNQTFPGSEGTKLKGWPTWTVPVMRWAKEQGGITGYPHSAMHVNPDAAAASVIDDFDQDADGMLNREESKLALLPQPFETIDDDQDGKLTKRELRLSVDRVADQLPNLAVPAMNGAGAMEIFVSTAEGVCDFVSAMDTARIPEWNTWYHILNCGFPLKLSGETDFPCMSSRRVGQGRVYVDLGDIDEIDFGSWCRGIQYGRAYVSDGYAHAIEFTVDGTKPGRGDVRLATNGQVSIKAAVAFAPELPQAVAYGTLSPAAGRRMIGDTVNLHAPRSEGVVPGGMREVEIIVNGRVVARQTFPADGNVHRLSVDIPIERSSWVALRQFPQLHTNPVNVIVDNQPIRASAASARWCIESIKLLWKNRQDRISEHERPAAKQSYDRAIARYRDIMNEAEADSRQ